MFKIMLSEYVMHLMNFSNVNKVNFSQKFELRLCSPSLHLFDQNTVKIITV